MCVDDDGDDGGDDDGDGDSSIGQSKSSSYAARAELMRLTARPHTKAHNVMESLEYDDDDDDDNDDSDNDDKDDEGEKEVVYMLARDNIWERAIEYQESERAMATLLSPEWQLSQITTQPF